MSGSRDWNNLDKGSGKPSQKGGKPDLQEMMRRRYQNRAPSSASSCSDNSSPVPDQAVAPGGAFTRVVPGAAGSSRGQRSQGTDSNGNVVNQGRQDNGQLDSALTKVLGELDVKNSKPGVRFQTSQNEAEVFENNFEDVEAGQSVYQRAQGRGARGRGGARGVPRGGSARGRLAKYSNANIPGGRPDPMAMLASIADQHKDIEDPGPDSPGAGEEGQKSLAEMLAGLDGGQGQQRQEGGADSLAAMLRGGRQRGSNPLMTMMGRGGGRKSPSSGDPMEGGRGMDPMAALLGGGMGGGRGMDPMAALLGGGMGGGRGMDPMAALLGGGGMGRGGGGGGGMGGVNPMESMMGGANPLAGLMGGRGGGGANPLASMLGGGGGGGGGEGNMMAQMMSSMMGGGGGGGGNPMAQMMSQLLGGEGGGGQSDVLQQMMGQAMGRGQGQGQVQGGMGRGGGGRGRGQEEEIDPNNASDGQIIHQMLEYETMKAKNAQCQRSQGMNTILVVDTSGSMDGEPLREAGQFIAQYLNGLEEVNFEYGLEENVALVCVGSQTQVVQHLTCDYTLVRNATDTLFAEGASRLDIALHLPLALFNQQETEKDPMAYINDHIIAPRILLLSDGHMSNKPDVPGQPPDPTDQESLLLQNLCVERVQPVIRRTLCRLHCVPLGNANINFLEMLANSTGGRIYQPSEPREASRCYLHHFLLGLIAREGGDMQDDEFVRNTVKQALASVDDSDVDGVKELIAQGEPDIKGRDEMLAREYQEAMQKAGHTGMPGQGGGGQGGMSDLASLVSAGRGRGGMRGGGGGGMEAMLGGRGGGRGGMGGMEALLGGGGRGGGRGGGLGGMEALLGGGGRGGGLGGMEALFGGGQGGGRGGGTGRGGGVGGGMEALLGGGGGGGGGVGGGGQEGQQGEGGGDGGSGMAELEALLGGSGDGPGLEALLAGGGGRMSQGGLGEMAKLLGGTGKPERGGGILGPDALPGGGGRYGRGLRPHQRKKKPVDNGNPELSKLFASGEVGPGGGLAGMEKILGTGDDNEELRDTKKMPSLESMFGKGGTHTGGNRALSAFLGDEYTENTGFPDPDPIAEQLEAAKKAKAEREREQEREFQEYEEMRRQNQIEDDEEFEREVREAEEAERLEKLARQQGAIPGQRPNPGQQQPMPKQQQAIPKQQQAIPKQQQAIPKQQQAIPKQQQAIHKQQQAVPKKQQEMPKKQPKGGYGPPMGGIGGMGQTEQTGGGMMGGLGGLGGFGGLGGRDDGIQDGDNDIGGFGGMADELGGFGGLGDEMGGFGSGNGEGIGGLGGRQAKEGVQVNGLHDDVDDMDEDSPVEDSEDEREYAELRDREFTEEEIKGACGKDPIASLDRLLMGPRGPNDPPLDTSHSALEALLKKLDPENIVKGNGACNASLDEILGRQPGESAANFRGGMMGQDDHFLQNTVNNVRRDDRRDQQAPPQGGVQQGQGQDEDDEGQGYYDNDMSEMDELE